MSCTHDRIALERGGRIDLFGVRQWRIRCVECPYEAWMRETTPADDKSLRRWTPNANCDSTYQAKPFEVV